MRNRQHLALVGPKASAGEPSRLPPDEPVTAPSLPTCAPSAAGASPAENFLLDAVVQPVIDSLNETAAELERLLEKLRG